MNKCKCACAFSSSFNFFNYEILINTFFHNIGHSSVIRFKEMKNSHNTTTTKKVVFSGK